jgi:hypothetical protein
MEAVAEVLCPGERIALLDRIIDLHKSCRRDRDRDSAPSFAYDHDHDHDNHGQPDEDLLAELARPTCMPRPMAAAAPAMATHGKGQGPLPQTPSHQPLHQVKTQP